MPILKRQCPPEDVIYDVEGRGARHTLFSSTAVLQGGDNDHDEVLAVVSATGRTLAAANLQVAYLLSMTACAVDHGCLSNPVMQPALSNMLASCVQRVACKSNANGKTILLSSI